MTVLQANQTPPRDSLGRSLINIIDRPAQTFEVLKQRRDWARWGLPLLLLAAAFAISTAAQIPFIMDAARQQAETQLATLPPDQAEAARSTMEFTLSLPVILATSLGFGLIAMLLGLVVQATLFYFGSFIAGGEDVNFGEIFTMNTWARLPLALGFLVQAVFVTISQGTIKYPGLAFLVAIGNPLEDATNPLVPLLSSIDLFWLWSLLLVTIGLTVVARLNRWTALLLTLLYAALALGLTVLPSLLFGGGLAG